MSDQLDDLWDALLSRNPSKVQVAFLGLERNQQNFVLQHLNRMVSEVGWHPEQRESASAALKALTDLSKADQNSSG